MGLSIIFLVMNVCIVLYMTTKRFYHKLPILATVVMFIQLIEGVKVCRNRRRNQVIRIRKTANEAIRMEKQIELKEVSSLMTMNESSVMDKLENNVSQPVHRDLKMIETLIKIHTIEWLISSR